MASKISSDFPYLVPISLPIPKYVCPLGSASLPTLSILHSSRRVLTPPCFQLTFIFVSDQTAIGTWAREPKEYQMARRNATISSLPTQKCRSSRFHLLPCRCSACGGAQGSPATRPSGRGGTGQSAILPHCTGAHTVTRHLQPRPALKWKIPEARHFFFWADSFWVRAKA